MGVTVFVQSAVIGGVNIGPSDILLFLIFFLMLPVLHVVRIQPGYVALVGMYLTWCVASFAWAGDYTKSIAPTVQYIEFMVIGVLVFSSLSSTEVMVKCLRIYAAFASLLGLCAILYAVATSNFSVLYFFDWHKNALGSIVGNAVPMICGLLLMPGQRGKKRLFIALGICLLALLMSTSRGSMLGAIVGACVLFLLIYRTRLVLLLGIVGYAVFYLYTNFIATDYLGTLTRNDKFSSTYSRITIFNDVSSKIAQHPIIGHGLGNYYIEIPYIQFAQNDPNNVFLLNLVEIGSIGLFLFALLLIYLTVYAFKNRYSFRTNPKYLVLSATCFAVFISQLTHIQVDVSWLRGTGLVMFGCIGMMMALPHLYKREVNES